MEKKPKGLGDSIANFLEVSGMKTVVKKIQEAVDLDDCGCDKRQDKLNKIFPYKNKK